MTRSTQHLDYERACAFIDGELSAAETRAVEEHLAACHACALRILSATHVKAATTRASKEFVVPPEAIGRLTAQLRAQTQAQTKSLDSPRFSTWAGVAASLILVVALTGWWQVRRPGDLTAELLDQHLAVLSGASAPQVISSDRHTVKPWFQGKLPFSFNLPETLPPGTTLLGGDLTFLQGQPAALLLFTIGKHRVSVFLTQRTSVDTQPASREIRSGFSAQSATTHDLRIVGVSDVNPADLTILLSALADAQSPR